MSKGENDIEDLEVAIKSKGGYCFIMILVWLHGTGVVLDGNSFKWKNSDQVLKMMKNKEVHKCIVQKVWTRRYPDQEVNRYSQEPHSEGAVPQFTFSNAEKCTHMEFIMFGPWYLTHRT